MGREGRFGGYGLQRHPHLLGPGATEVGEDELKVTKHRRLVGFPLEQLASDLVAGFHGGESESGSKPLAWTPAPASAPSLPSVAEVRSPAGKRPGAAAGDETEVPRVGRMCEPEDLGRHR